MQIWLIEDGKKEGPFLDYEIRSRIQSGELTKERKVWHSDLDGWTPLGEVSIFTSEFEPKKVDADNVGAYLEKVEAEEAAATAPVQVRELNLPPTVKLHLWRRFGARWFDYTLYSVALLGVILLVDADFMKLQGAGWFPFVSILPWIFFESLALTFWGTTPGKWLVGLKVRSGSGEKLLPMISIMRSLRVMILGMGFVQPILLLLCHSISAWLGFKKNIVLWDTPLGTTVSLDRPSPEKWVGFGVGMATLILVVSVLTYSILGRVDVDSLPPEEQKQFRQLFPFREEAAGEAE